MASAHDFGALNWVKGELDETVRQARCALESFVEQPTKHSTIQTCINGIHQVQGILHMVQLYGPAMLAEEMELVAVALKDGKVRQLEDAAEALMLALIQFPDYLEKLQGGEPDIPLVILPLMNDLRATRDAPLLTEAALFSPTLEETQVSGRVDGEINPKLPEIARRIRHRYHLGLLNWFRNMEGEKGFQLLANVLAELVEHAGSETVHRVFWVAQAVVEGLKEGDVGSGVAVKLLLGKVDREIKRIIDGGENAIIDAPSTGLLKNLLYYVAQSTSDNPHLVEVKRVYQLQNALPSEDEIAAGRKSLNSINIDLLESVKSAIKNELTVVKDTLDLYIRGDRSQFDPLIKIKQPLSKVADTLGMVGQGALRSRLVRQVDFINSLEENSAGLDDDVLMDMAGDILFVESTVNSLSEITSVSSDEETPEAAWGTALPPGEYQSLVKKAVHEAKVDIAKVKEAIIRFVALPDDTSVLTDVPYYFRNVGGALKILLLTDASDTLEQLSHFISDELLEKGIHLESHRLNALAEVISCIEYYLESLVGGVGDRQKTLAIANASMKELLTTPSSEKVTPDALGDDESDTTPAIVALDEMTLPEAPESLEKRADEPAIESPPSSEKPPLEDIDPEILEIFVEEAREEIEGLEMLLPRWKSTPEDSDILVVVRRSFHTLKGSGRLVGAITIGELAWSVENMLNRLLDETIPASPLIIELLEDVVAVLPQFVDCLERSEVPLIDSAPFMDRANAFSESGAPVSADRSLEEPSAESELEEPSESIELELDQDSYDAEMVEDLAVDSDYSPPQDQDSIGYERDTELMEIFVSEAQAHLTTLEDFVRVGESSDQPQQVSNAIIRASHTLRGCARTAGIDAMALIGEALEKFTNLLQSNDLVVDKTHLIVIKEGVDLGQALLSALLHEESPFPDHEPYLDQLKMVMDEVAAELANDEPSSTESSDLIIETEEEPLPIIEQDESDAALGGLMGLVVLDEDEELLEIFIEESHELIEVLSTELQQWRNRRDAWPQLVTLKRTLHTFKGSSRLVGATPMGDLCQAMESLLTVIYQQKIVVDDAAVELIQRSADRLAQQTDEVEKVARVTLANDLVDELYTCAASFTAVGQERASDAAEVKDDGANVIQLTESDLTFDELLEVSSVEENAELSPTVEGDADLEAADEDEDEHETLEITALAPPPVEDEWVHEVPASAASDEDLELVDEFGLASDSVESVFADSELYTSEAAIELSEDDELIDIFLEEASELSESLAEAMQHWHAGEDQSPLIEQLLRTLHTLKGSARLVGALPIGDLCHAVESLLIIIDSGEVAADTKVKRLIQLSVDRLASQVDEVEHNHSVASAERLIERLKQACSAAPAQIDEALPAEEEQLEEDQTEGDSDELLEVTPFEEEVVQEVEAPSLLDEFPDSSLISESVESLFADSKLYATESITKLTSDVELVEIFIEEARELSESIEETLQRWHAGEADAPVIEQLQRILHTVKGSARLVGATPMGDLSHAVESLLTLIDNGEVASDSKIKRLVQLSMDRLASQVDEIENSHTVTSSDRLIERLEQFSRGETTPSAEVVPFEVVALSSEEVDAPFGEEPESDLVDTEVSPEAEDDVEQASSLTPVYGEGEKISRFSSLEDEEKVREAEAKSNAPRSQMRINSTLLDKMVNQAGEVSIYRSRLEQQNSTLKFNLIELDRTVVRLHDQLRKLDIETETQILFRHESDADKVDDHADFDPLELDRFSTMQQVSRSLMETVSDLGSIRGLLEEQQRDTETLLLQQSRVAVELQDGLLHTRMVSFSQLVPRLSRLVRQTAIQTGSEAELVVEGAEGEMDRSILDRIVPALEHLLRNAVAHGIEQPNRRVEKGKPKVGKVTLTLSQEGTNVLLVLEDDGAGLNLKKIREKALAQGLLDQDEKVSDDDLMQLVFESGFSTAKEITQIAGRGVGLDAVSNEVKQLGGLISLSSESGKGACFTIQLPLTLAITDALLVQMGEHIYAVPHGSIEGVVRIDREDLLQFYEDSEQRYSYAGKEYKVEYLGHLLDSGTPALLEGERWFPVLLVDIGEHQVALQVDALLGTRQVVIKAVGSQIASLSWVTGGTILGDGRVALIADLSALVRTTSRSAATIATHKDDIEDLTITAMVVDDSITVRKVTARLLERHDMQVITAKDGVDAISVLQEHHPDVVLLDIEMPRMDGFELARHMRNSNDWSDIPIIMISSRVGEKHRKRAFELGVKSCLGKPFQEAELLENIHAVLKEEQT
ncbi:MAG: Hpt domain-containing protein [Candidatus Polarisedimenticolaceae bacterium]|nr:Hpt domain-containing protein [Candidatus Polarisedimenticolaceae bacterium]